MSMVMGQPGQQATVATPSIERQAMDEDLRLISDIREGAPAMRRGCGTYLPRYPMEGRQEYSRRVAAAPWRPEFVECLHNLASKPFAREIDIGSGAPQVLKDFCNDVDGANNDITAFSRCVFEEGVATGLHLILVDYPAIAPTDNGRPRTVAEEAAIGAEPYWVGIGMDRIIALRTSNENGREVVQHLRFWECSIEPDGDWGEKETKRIRVLDPGVWSLWEQDEKGDWQVIDAGTVSLPEVPVAIFRTGERKGCLRTKPPLRDLADVQVELFRSMSRYNEILEYSGSPMLAGSNVSKPDDKEPQVTIGPRTILFAPPCENGTASWNYISPNGDAIGEVRQQVQDVIANLRQLGKQPMTPQSGTVTATATSVEAAKAHSALQAWAVGLKDALETALYYTSQFYSLPSSAGVAVDVFTDFAIGDQSAPEGMVLLTAQKQDVLSAQTVRDELKRRGLLGPSFDESQEDQRIAEERQGLEPEDDNFDPRGNQTNDNSTVPDDLQMFPPEILKAAGF